MSWGKLSSNVPKCELWNRGVYAWMKEFLVNKRTEILPEAVNFIGTSPEVVWTLEHQRVFSTYWPFFPALYVDERIWSSKQSWQNVLICSILQKRKLRHRGIKSWLSVTQLLNGGTGTQRQATWLGSCPLQPSVSTTVNLHHQALGRVCRKAGICIVP